ncbi:sugar ABC transporter substrate-binding protein [Labrys monachus]|uniref:Ribose transport system substrate-binding protein n=1 Tax=Labrys monachus TaxID=217067 RepID=A0ABU0FA92_9HYPH|nr:sugar ABC transporter substrate-binding protein [Labrys monachus]MDQ0390993.1 ribose transport system substrate-binding protein [Labrys monachus]
MSFIKNFIEQETLNRRNFLLASALGLGGAAAASLARPSIARASIADPTIAWSYRDRTNPYWNAIASGGEAFVESLGKPKSALVQLINEGSSEKSLSDVKALLGKTDGRLALAIDANDSPNGRPVVEAVAAKGAYVSTIWNKTDDLHPWDFGDNYVSHMTWSDVGPSEQTATILFKAMGGKGAIVGLGGIASNNPAIERRHGLDNALKNYPDIKLLDYQAADWDTQKANAIMASYLTRFGDQITGVFCANDTMAYGVIEALRAEGLAGQIPIVAYDGNAQAVDLVLAGDLLATVSTNPYWGGGVTAALAYYAAIGAFKPSQEPREHREFYGPTILITKAEAEDFKKKYIQSTPSYNWKDFWGPSKGQIMY